MNILSPFEETLDHRLLFDPNGKDVPPNGAVRGEYKFSFDTSSLLRADKQARFVSYVAGVGAHILTPNDCRAEEDMPPIAGGDTFPDTAKTVNVNNNGGTPIKPNDAADHADEEET